MKATIVSVDALGYWMRSEVVVPGLGIRPYPEPETAKEAAQMERLRAHGLLDDPHPMAGQFYGPKRRFGDRAVGDVLEVSVRSDASGLYTVPETNT